MCLPAGARVESNRAGLYEQNKRAFGEVSPFRAADSDALISAAVPPRWTVAARRHSWPSRQSAE